MGITWSEFWHMNPHIISCVADGYKKRIEEKDALMHFWWGTYGLSALGVAIEHCFNGKNAKSKYIENPLWSERQEDQCKKEEKLTEEEKKKQTEMFFTKLRVLEANHKLTKKE